MNIKKDLRKINETPQEAIKLIAQYGGFSSLAHPKDCFMSMGSLEKLVEKLKSFGLNGMECIYTTHSDKEIEQFKEIAARNNLIVTGGTDFHGLRKPGVELGSGYGELIIPYDILNSLKK